MIIRRVSNVTGPVRVTFCGDVISAIPLKKLPNGNWLMSSCVKHRFERFDVGHLIEISPQELIDQPPEVTNAVEAIGCNEAHQEGEECHSQASVR
jgi:hypothetical protein